VAWKALAALILFASGAVAAFAVYSAGWHNSATRTVTTTIAKRDPYVRTVTDAAGTHRVFTLRSGDVVRRPQAAVECGAYQEGGFANLHCFRIGGGRHTFVFYNDSVQVFGPGAEPLTPTDSFDWQPR